MEVENDYEYYNYYSFLIDYENSENVTIEDQKWQKVYYFCFEKECPYVFKSNSLKSEPSIEKIYSNTIAKKMSKDEAFRKFWNDFEKETQLAIELADNYIPEDEHRRVDTVGNDRLLQSEIKGYYYEDVKYSRYEEVHDIGYYNGYFIVNNLLIIIEERSAGFNTMKVKMVKEIPDSKEVAIASLDDLDQEKSGIFPDRYSSLTCKGFISIKYNY